ncbi:MAG: HAMP domain-containing sensor histidine kinase [Flavobacteriaceae bacterium]|nr:HAMP domain-containing sensor histidine kinase [Flavobacteriaceae bacterium]
MNRNGYSYVIYFILAVILAVLVIQVYWNYKNYQQNSQQLKNEIQTSLDNAIDKYYTELAEKTTIGFAYNRDSLSKSGHAGTGIDSILGSLKFVEKERTLNLDSMSFESHENIMVFKGSKADSMMNTANSESSKLTNLNSLDSLRIESLNVLTSKIVISIKNDSVNLNKVDTYLKEELSRKNAEVDYGLQLKIKDSITQSINPKTINTADFKIVSSSSLLPSNAILEMPYKNATKIILTRSLTGILISFLLIIAVATILVYLLKIIRDQKQLAEMKDDFISNITHEFKTPIATVSVALESMRDFKVLDDREKTNRYIDMSESQLDKLNTMVERLLEVARLETDEIHLKKEPVNLNSMISILVENHKISSLEKNFTFHPTDENTEVFIDKFHFENVLNNLIDNAVKYGGQEIVVDLKKHDKTIEISVIDNGSSLSKLDAQRIFEKFYRIPKGNTHDVKGFGIGLYYSKKIVEKHGGNLNLELTKERTTFKILLPIESV